MQDQNISNPEFFEYAVDLGSNCTFDPLSGAAWFSLFPNWPNDFSPAVVMDNFAKIPSSTILTDMGVSDESNIIANLYPLMHFIIEAHDMSGGSFSSQTPSTDNATAFFDSLGTGVPSVTPSTISARYLCQVPVLKPIGSLIVSILIADLVFLQVLWKLLNWAVTFGLERRHEAARYRLGCTKQMQHSDYELVEKRSAVSGKDDEEEGLGVRVTSSEVLEGEEPSTRQRVVPKGTQTTPLPSATA